MDEIVVEDNNGGLAESVPNRNATQEPINPEGEDQAVAEDVTTLEETLSQEKNRPQLENNAPQ